MINNQIGNDAYDVLHNLKNDKIRLDEAYTKIMDMMKNCHDDDDGLQKKKRQFIKQSDGCCRQMILNPIIGCVTLLWKVILYTVSMIGGVWILIYIVKFFIWI
jgi:hypothetical protein